MRTRFAPERIRAILVHRSPMPRPMSDRSPRIAIDEAYLRDVLARLVRTPSINPLFDATSRGEREVADVVAQECRGLGMEVTRSEPEPGRISIIGRTPGAGAGRSLMLYAHHDTVGIEGMPEPFSASVHDDKMFGRGTYDMKGGLAACLAAVRGLRDAGQRLRGDLVIAAVADEEVASIGMTDVLRLVRTDGAIVTESTELGLCTAHKGFSWIEVETVGRAAHGSRFQEGVDANMRMGRFLAQLDGLERSLRTGPGHPLLGPPSLHVGVLSGGTGESTYAARSTAKIERRMLPNETEGMVVGQIRDILDRLSALDETFRATVRPMLTRPSFEVREDATIVGAVRDAATALLGSPPVLFGAPYWMDASLIAARGTETVVFGPIGAGAHALEEWVDLTSVGVVAGVLADAATTYCGLA
jgi:acetylornithine deacetylase/succinyl-diaminopimelate desuccinylase-like protein